MTRRVAQRAAIPREKLQGIPMSRAPMPGHCLDRVDRSCTGVVSSWDSDGFTIMWTKSGTPTGTLTVNFLCQR
jgi:hypothetical protein